jgi:hypothetical protein
MLGSLRKSTKGIFAYTIVGLITVPFLLTGLDQYISVSPERGVKVNGIMIHQGQIDRAVNSEMARIGDVPETQADVYRKAVEKSVKERMIREKVAQFYSLENNLGRSKRKMREEILKTEEFSEKGKFSVEKYKTLLNMNGLTTAKYERMVSDYTAQVDMMNKFDIAQDADSMDITNKQLTYAKKVLLKIAKVDMTKFNPTVEELKAHYEVTKTSYNTQKLIDLNIVDLSLEKIISNIEITEDMVNSEYKMYVRGSSLATPNKMIHRIAETKEEAQVLLAKMDSNLDSFKESSYEASEIEDFGADVLEQWSNTKANTGKVFESEFGWNAIWAYSEREQQTPKDEKLKEIRENLLSERVDLERNKMTSALDSLIYEEGLSGVEGYLDVDRSSKLGMTYSELLELNKSEADGIFSGDIKTGRYTKGDIHTYFETIRVIPASQMDFDTAMKLVKKSFMIEWQESKSKEMAEELQKTTIFSGWDESVIEGDVFKQKTYEQLILDTATKTPEMLKVGREYVVFVDSMEELNLEKKWDNEVKGVLQEERFAHFIETITSQAEIKEIK